MFKIPKKLFSKDADNLSQLINSEAFLVDVRSSAEFLSGNITGSVNIPVNQIQNNLDKFIDKKNIVVFCRSGMRSSQAKAILERNGITKVTNGGTLQNVKNLLTK